MSNTIAPPSDALEFTSFASPIDLTDSAHCRLARMAVMIELISGSGTASVDTEEGEAREITLSTPGDKFICNMRRIVSVSGITRLRASWNK